MEKPGFIECVALFTETMREQFFSGNSAKRTMLVIASDQDIDFANRNSDKPFLSRALFGDPDKNKWAVSLSMSECSSIFNVINGASIAVCSRIASGELDDPNEPLFKLANEQANTSRLSKKDMPRIVVNDKDDNDNYKFYFNPKQSDLDDGIIAWLVDIEGDARHISNEWVLVGTGNLRDVQEFIASEDMKCAINRGAYTFNCIVDRWECFPFRFKDDTSKFDQLKIGDILRHRHKKVIAVLKCKTWGYYNNGEFIPFRGCEKFRDAIQWKDGEYWDLDYAERIGNIFKERR